MRRIIVLILVMLPFKLLAIDVKIVADVNGEPISNLDVEKRVKLITSLLGRQNIDQEEMKLQILKQLIDEIIIVNESQKLSIKLNDEELNSSIALFLTQNFGIKAEAEEASEYIKKHDIDLKALTKQIKYQLLWNKIIEARIVPFLGGVSDEEVENARRQIEKSDYLIVLQEIIVPEQENVELLMKELRNNDSFTPNPPIKMHKVTVSLNQLKGRLKDNLKNLKVGDIISFNDGYQSIIKVIDRVKIDYELLNSTLTLKQTIVEDVKSVLENFKKQKVDCSNFNKVANDLKLENMKELKIKMRDLNPELQFLFNDTVMNKISEIKEENTTRLIMLCNIKRETIDIEAIKRNLFQQKIATQSNLLFDNIRKNAVVHYHKTY